MILVYKVYIYHIFICLCSCLFPNGSKTWFSVFENVAISIEPKSDSSIGLTISLMMRQHSNRKVERKGVMERKGAGDLREEEVGEKMMLK